ncbi:MAG: Uma2 family endonuclease [Treponema sp.]|nr:Uma2 family endonuclease [Treponema sp.]
MSDSKPHEGGGRFTYADYRRWPEGERWELAGGAAYAMSPASGWHHQEVAGYVFAVFKTWLGGKPCRAFIAPLDVFLPEPGREPDEADEVDTVLQPDAGIVCDRSKIFARGLWGAPDLALEVLSPSTVLRDLNQKRELYEAAGVREYWLIDGRAEYGIIFRREGPGGFDQGSTYEEDELMPSSIFGGLAIHLGELRASLA